MFKKLFNLFRKSQCECCDTSLEKEKPEPKPERVCRSTRKLKPARENPNRRDANYDSPSHSYNDDLLINTLLFSNAADIIQKNMEQEVRYEVPAPPVEAPVIHHNNPPCEAPEPVSNYHSHDSGSTYHSHDSGSSYHSHDSGSSYDSSDSGGSSSFD